MEFKERMKSCIPSGNYIIPSLIFTCCIVFQAALATGQPLKLLSSSTVQFEVENLWVNTVSGAFSQMNGKIIFSPEAPDSAKFDLRLPASTLETGIGKRDEHLKGPDFFYVEKYPDIHVVSDKIARTDDPNVFNFSGQLEIRGVSKPLQCLFSYNEKNDVRYLQSTFTINRKAFDLGKNTNTLTVAEDVIVAVELHLMPTE